MKTTFVLAACALVAACASSPAGAIEPALGEPAPPASAASTGAVARTPDAPASPDAEAPTPRACGTRARGAERRTLQVGGVARTVVVYVPTTLDPGAVVPLVIVHHGFTMSGQAMRDVTGYADLADREGFVVAFPDGQGGPDSLDAPWNVGANVCPSLYGEVPVASGDDFAFLDAIKADVAAEQCLDPAHFYVSGFSMGGYFAHHAGCMRDDVRAIAPSSGGTHALDGCSEARKPVLIVHGDADDVIPAGCDLPGATDTPSGFTPSAAAWAAHNGCSDRTRTTEVEKGSCVAYEDCPAGGQVTACTMHGMGHCWAGGTKDSSGNGCPGFASATELEWSFFKTYAW